jgi:hypothetical protein
MEFAAKTRKNIRGKEESDMQWQENLQNEAGLEALLAEPSEKLIVDMAQIKGSIMVLGAGGKMGPSLCRLIRNARQGRRHFSRHFRRFQIFRPEGRKYVEGNGRARHTL